jgi:hypothetical protein
MDKTTNDQSTEITKSIYAALCRRFPNEDPECLFKKYADLVDRVRRSLVECCGTIGECEQAVATCVNRESTVALRDNPFHEGLTRALSIP